MKNLLEQLPVGILIFQGEAPYSVVAVNEEFYKTTGYNLQDIEEMSRENNNFLDREDLRIVKVAMKEALRSRCSGEYELHLQNKDGTYQWYVFRMAYHGEDQTFTMSIWNINERKLVEEELYVQSERYMLVESITGELPFEYDVESKETLISRKYLAMYKMENAIEHFAKRSEIEEYIHKLDVEKFFRAMEEASEQEIHGTLELRVRAGSVEQTEEYVWYRLIYKSILNMEQKVIRVVGRMENINQEKLEHAQLSERAKKDALTGILNKAATREEIEEFLSSGKAQEQRHAMLVIDIDNFKDINDTFGHLFGDTVLISIAENIVSVFRRDDVIGRVGGDEFLVFMKNVEKDIVLERAEKLCQKLRQQYEGEKQNVGISCSVGVALYNVDGASYQELFEKADYAMYQAKDSGKNQYRLAENENMAAGFRKRPGRDRGIDHERKGLDEGFLMAAFSLLSHAKDVNGSLNLLLERIGKRYDLDVVAVLESDREEQEFVQTNCWKENSGILVNPVYRAKFTGLEMYMTGVDERGVLCVDNYGEIGEQVQLKSGRRISALVNCSFNSQDGKEGMVTFCKMDKEHKWTEFEKETFLELSKIVSVFVALKRNQLETQNTILSLQSRDLITGLLNETAFRKYAQEKILNRDPSMQYAVVFSDICEFSYVNENFGNEAGNQILREFAKKLTSAQKNISCRMYSDLFISLIWAEDREHIQQFVDQIMQEFVTEQRKKYARCNMRLVSGVYFMKEEDEDIDIAIENANLTRKKIKRHSGQTACQVYSEEIRLQREKEKRITMEFEKTLQDDRFVVYIQPKFLLKSKEMNGGEALVRWIKEDGGMEFPNDFIPVIEKTGQIVELDFYVLEQVLKYMCKWKEEGKQLYRISVNFSRKHFEDAGIYNKICELTEQYQIEHKYIEIEITESLWVSGLDTVKTEMQLLRKAGFAVAIDDFGTGYSSLNMLQEVPADIVKIDKSFLDKQDMDKERDFIQKIGALIHSVKEEIIFEGIETERQLEFLVSCGFRYGQGYLYERPIPIEMFEGKYMK